ncbi:TolC family protein [Mucilaginibacter agri]|uniref:TolC family protein n=1 Tax=Mucilaginibacter agri TaxID=2695265 RepID=A0A966DQA2_9SPHI|nr:TolC family protein [Mucilaginibacter agri]NCD67838.1 TolC family protein [Mucilaginibacter agri]
MEYPALKAPFKFSLLIACIVFLGIPAQVSAQSGRVYLDSLLKTASVNYPLIKAKRLQTQALQSAVKYKENGIIPTLTASYQADYATYNNITGMIYPQYITPISGPPSVSNNYSGVFGSALALDLLWEPITFGQRGADIDLAKGRAQTGKADEELTLFRQQVYVVNAWLNYLIVNDLIKVYQEDFNRSEFNLKQAQSLVTSGLRPGTDSSSFSAEYTRNQIQLIAFERRRDSTLITLKELVGGRLPAGMILDTTLYKHLPVLTLADTSTSEHPEITLAKTAITTNELALKSLQKSIMPHLTLWSTGYGRGSGIAANGAVNSSDGLGFQRYNYAVGAQISFSILEMFRQKPLWRQHELNTAASREQLNQTELQLNSQKEIADVALAKNLQSAGLAPRQYQSALFSYQAIRARYQSGLINYYDVIQAQQLLFQSEAAVKIANYNAWKSLLSKAAYEGNLNLFLNQYGK